jgi:hypothetical protein
MSYQQSPLFLKHIRSLFLAESVVRFVFKQNLVAYPPAYDYGLFTSISTYPNLLTFQPL